MAAVVTESVGCGTPAYKKEQAARLLQEKYGETFEITAMRGSGFLGDYYSVIAYSDEYPDLLFSASVENDYKSISDTYVTKRLCSRISDKISQNMGMLNCNYYILTEAQISGTVVTDPEVTLDDYLKESPKNVFTVYVFLDEENANAQNIVSAFSNLLSGLPSLRGTMTLYLVDPELLGNIQEYLNTHDNTYAEFDDMTEDAYIGYVDFGDGVISLTETELREMAGDRL